MVIEKGSVVTMEYRIETDKGELIESSVGKGAPLQFVFGGGKMLHGLEKRIQDMKVGEEREFEIPPEEAFGVKDGGPIREMDKSEFPRDTVFKAGERFTARLPDDKGSVIFEIIENKATSVVVRFHHPHEGKRLKCKVKIVDVKPPVRRSSQEPVEIEPEAVEESD